MGSMVMTTFMMFVPRHVVFLFLAICCVGFFGIYVPYNESKEKGEVWKPLRWLKRMTSLGVRREGPSPAASRRLDQLERLREAGIISKEEYKQRRKELDREL